RMVVRVMASLWFLLAAVQPQYSVSQVSASDGKTKVGLNLAGRILLVTALPRPGRFAVGLAAGFDRRLELVDLPGDGVLAPGGCVARHCCHVLALGARLFAHLGPRALHPGAPPRRPWCA